jgi:hypothetical protein
VAATRPVGNCRIPLYWIKAPRKRGAGALRAGLRPVLAYRDESKQHTPTYRTTVMTNVKGQADDGSGPG